MPGRAKGAKWYAFIPRNKGPLRRGKAVQRKSVTLEAEESDKEPPKKKKMTKGTKD
jgi:hypothetical protein